MGSVSPRQSAAAHPATNALRVNVERVAFVFLPIETILMASLPFLRILSARCRLPASGGTYRSISRMGTQTRTLSPYREFTSTSTP